MNQYALAAAFLVVGLALGAWYGSANGLPLRDAGLQSSAKPGGPRVCYPIVYADGTPGVKCTTNGGQTWQYYPPPSDE